MQNPLDRREGSRIMSHLPLCRKRVEINEDSMRHKLEARHPADEKKMPTAVFGGQGQAQPGPATAIAVAWERPSTA